MHLIFRSSLRAVIVLYIAVLFVFSSRATSYFVDYSSGSDAANGTSTSSAWQHCPGDPAAGGNPASTTLSPGDTVYFKGGVKYVFAANYSSFTFLYQSVCNPGIQLNWFGTANAPITYDGNSSGSWGTGRAILTDNCSTNQIGAFLNYNSISNLVFNSFEIGPIGGSATLPVDPGFPVQPNPGGGIGSTAGIMQNVTISNCYFHGLGYWFNQQPMSAGTIKGGAIGSSGCDNVHILNCAFTQMNAPIGFGIPTYVSNLTVANCVFSNSIVWCMWFGFQSPNGAMDNVFIHDNEFVNNDQSYSASVWTGYGAPPHQDGINLFADSVTNNFCGTNIDIYNNYFHNTTTYAGGTACIFLVGNTSANIYNNLFISNSVANGIITMNLTSTYTPYTVRVFNNTFYETGPSSFYGGMGGSTQTTNSFIQWMNNICCQVQPGYNGYDYVLVGTYVPSTYYFTMDYNCYVSANFNNSAIGFYSGLLGYLTLPVLQTNGWEIHGMQKDPQFVNVALNNFSVQSNSPAVGAGVDLSSYNLPGLTSDYAGNPRSGAWTIGAYQIPSTNLPVGPGTFSTPPTPVALPQVKGLHILH